MTLIQLLEDIIFLAVNLTWQPIAQILDAGLILYLIGKYGIKWLSTSSMSKHPSVENASSLEGMLDKVVSLQEYYQQREEVLAHRARKIEGRIAQATQLLDSIQPAKRYELELYLNASIKDRKSVQNQHGELKEARLPTLNLLRQEIEQVLAEEKGTGRHPSPEQLQHFQQSLKKLVKTS